MESIFLWQFSTPDSEDWYMVPHVTAFSAHHIPNDLPILPQKSLKFTFILNCQVAVGLCNFTSVIASYCFLKLKDNHFIEYYFYNVTLLLKILQLLNPSSQTKFKLSLTF